MELYLLGQKYMKKDTVPQLIYGDTFVNLDTIKVDQQHIFSKLQNRICNLDTNRDLMKKVCMPDYRVLIETIVRIRRVVECSIFSEQSNHSE